MARVHKQKARTDIYQTGLRVPANNKQRYSLDRSQPANENDPVIIKKGQEYYSWQLHGQRRQVSLTYPRPQQLTQSDFMIQVYDMQDQQNALQAENYSDADEIQSALDEIREAAENLRDETQEKLDNMPENLQYSPTGELLQERIDACESFIDELENIDLDYDEPDEDELLEDFTGGMEETDYIDERKIEHFQEWAAEKIEEIQNISFDI